jgi:hypothetical protein
MQLALNRLAYSSRTIARIAFLPVVVLTAYLCSRTFSVEGITFIVIDALTIFGAILSMILALLVGFWWGECGHGRLDFALLIAGIAPFLILLWFLDPLGSAPVQF